VACASAGAAAISTPTTAKKANLSFLISIFLFWNWSPPMRSGEEVFWGDEKRGPTERPSCIISPASGMQPPLVQRRSSDAWAHNLRSSHLHGKADDLQASFSVVSYLLSLSF
jgi:hypothetical protein